MPWKEQSIVESREEFCRLARAEGSNIRALCRRYGISPTTGYTWLARYRTAGRAGLADRSRRPHRSPNQTAPAIEAEVIALRAEHPSWGGRKLGGPLGPRLKARLPALGTSPPVPSAGSITRILHRHGLISAQASAQHRPLTRFTAPVPNDLWQMDFKGHFALVGAGRCHPLTVLDDHSRFNLGLRALPHEQAATVQAELITLFQRYGLPNRILCDNSPPWGTAYRGRWTKLGVWLLLLDVGVIHGRPWHPQTQGKDERFHRTLNTELLRTRSFASLTEVQTAFDQWRIVYNQIRPHEALGLDPPIDHYQPSLRSYPERLPAVEYASGEVVRTVNSRGTIAIKGAHYYVGEGFTGYPVAIRPTADAALWDVYFRHYVIAQIDRRESAEQ